MLKEIFFGSLWMLGIVSLWAMIYVIAKSALTNDSNKGKSLKRGDDE